MASVRPFHPMHLGIFVSKLATGQPLARLPLYAEVAVPRIVPRSPVNERIIEPIIAALFRVDPDATSVRERVVEIALVAIGQTLTLEGIDTLVNEPDRTRALFVRVFRDVLEAAHQDH